MAEQIVIRADIYTHPKVKRAARKLKIKPEILAGQHLIPFMIYVKRFYPSGDLTGAMPGELADDGANWHGKAEVLLSALVGCGRGGKRGILVRDKETGALSLHDWLEEQEPVLAVERAQAEAVSKARKARESGAKGGGKSKPRKGKRRTPQAEGPSEGPSQGPSRQGGRRTAACAADVLCKGQVEVETSQGREVGGGGVDLPEAAGARGAQPAAPGTPARPVPSPRVPATGGESGAPAPLPSPQANLPPSSTSTSTTDHPTTEPGSPTTDPSPPPPVPQNATDRAAARSGGGRATLPKASPTAAPPPEGRKSPLSDFAGQAPEGKERSAPSALATPVPAQGAPCPRPDPGGPAPDEFTVRYREEPEWVAIAARESALAFCAEGVAVECARENGDEAVAWIATAQRRAESKRRGGYTGRQNWTKFVQSGCRRNNPRFENGGTPHGWARDQAKEWLKAEQARRMALLDPALREKLQNIGRVV